MFGLLALAYHVVQHSSGIFKVAYHDIWNFRLLLFTEQGEILKKTCLIL
jgi:hypothetical protein